MDFNEVLFENANKIKNASVEIIGRSVMGKELFIIRKGSGKKKLFLSAAHHANEWITALVLSKFSEEEEIPDGITAVILPLGNPDGASLVRGELCEGKYFEKARSISEKHLKIPFPEGWKANISGYDLNLSYPAGFYKAKEIKAKKGYFSPSPRDFCGEHPLSPCESMAVYRLVLKEKFDMLLSFHTQGKEIYYRYGEKEPHESFKIAKEMEKESGYKAVITPPESDYAGLKDWFILKYNKPAFTIEAGQGISPLPLDNFDEIYEECAKIIKVALKYLLLPN